MSRKFSFKLSYVDAGKKKESEGVLIADTSAQAVREVVERVQHEATEVSIVVKRYC